MPEVELPPGVSAYDADFAPEAPVVGMIANERGRFVVRMADHAGRVLWERFEPQTGKPNIADVVRVSPTGTYLVAVSMASTRRVGTSDLYVFGVDGDVIHTQQVHGAWSRARRAYEGGRIYAVAFSPGERLLAVALADEVVVYELVGARRVVRSTPGRGITGGRVPVSISVDDRGRVLVVTMAYEDVDPRPDAQAYERLRPAAFVLSAAGNILWTQEFEYGLRPWPQRAEDRTLFYNRATPPGDGRVDSALMDDTGHLIIDGTYFTLAID